MILAGLAIFCLAWLLACGAIAESARRRFFVPGAVVNQIAAAYWLCGCGMAATAAAACLVFGGR